MTSAFCGRHCAVADTQRSRSPGCGIDASIKTLGITNATVHRRTQQQHSQRKGGCVRPGTGQCCTRAHEVRLRTCQCTSEASNRHGGDSHQLLHSSAA
jgi:hypothetical protein